ncbi:hypothetical protein [Pedobacter sp. UBA5917]|jgi:hypothetical protein|uniref:hypothetical protein n=1 Tax=Pedobacter sp. UBA5917 TaxID=1947061 RepID=UPI0025DE7585|nr:hypothetical protein [Pedobacter sp. UBA5917]
MLIKTIVLDGIKSGKISLAFRKWNKPSAKKGSSIKTAVGIIEIIDVTIKKPEEITINDLKQAGFSGIEELEKSFPANATGNLYEIRLKYKSEDPRLQLRKKTSLSPDEFMLLDEKLNRLDKNSKKGDWTIAVLKAIANHPRLKAGDLALKLGTEKEWLKLNIRKLKNLGLTISYEPGYTLSPLGEYFLSIKLKD